MSDTPQVTIHYTDGTPSETRDMTPEELAELKTEPVEPSDDATC